VRSAGFIFIVGLTFLGCQEARDEPEYRFVAQGRYVEVVQSTELAGDVCPWAATEIDRQIEELAAEFGVAIPTDYELISRIEESESAANGNCELDVGGCFSPGRGGRPPTITSGVYFLPHEVVHAVQRMRNGAWPHVALLEGEAVLYQGLIHYSAITACPGARVSEAALREALDDRTKLGAYSIYHEIVVRVLDAYGRDGFDSLWAVSSEDRSTEALLQAFEDLFGISLFELTQQPSATCRDLKPGCVGLEQRTLTSSGLTLPVPTSCGEGVVGLETPADAENVGRPEQSFLLEIAEAGDVTISFSGPGQGQIEIAACDGFDTVSSSGQPVQYADENTNVAGTPRPHRFEPGLFRLIVTGLSNDVPADAHIDLDPVE